MTSAPTTPLRQRMIEDMTIRQFGPKTQHDYVRVVADFARFLGSSPGQAEPEDLRRYQLHLAAEGASPAKMNAAVSALRFFFKVTLARPGFGERLATVGKEDRLPQVLSPEEVALLLHCAPGLKHKAALSVAYDCGLRVSEIVHLKVGDIDSARMLIRVEQGKGRKDRYVMLSPDLLALLRRWWRAARPKGFTRWFGDLEGHWPPSLLLNDSGTGAKDAARRDVADGEPHEVAGPKLSVDGAVEHRQVSSSVADLQLLADRPDVLRLQRRLRTDDASCVPGLSEPTEAVGGEVARLPSAEPPLITTTTTRARMPPPARAP